MRGVHERRAKSIETKRLKSNSKGKTWSKSSGAPKVRNYDTDRHRDKKLILEQKSFPALHAHGIATCLL